MARAPAGAGDNRSDPTGGVSKRRLLIGPTQQQEIRNIKMKRSVLLGLMMVLVSLSGAALVNSAGAAVETPVLAMMGGGGGGMGGGMGGGGGMMGGQGYGGSWGHMDPGRSGHGDQQDQGHYPERFNEDRHRYETPYRQHEKDYRRNDRYRQEGRFPESNPSENGNADPFGTGPNGK